MLSAVVIIDYQNVNLTSANLFSNKLSDSRNHIHPEIFSEILIEKRNRLVADKSKIAELTKILVFRGLPSPDYDPKSHSLNINQAKRWEKSGIVKVTHRPLKYVFPRGNSYLKGLRNADNRRHIKRMEKGIDVLCAISLIREANHAGLVVLASQDTDLLPAIEEAHAISKAKIETCSWFSESNVRSKELWSPKARILNTRLGEIEYSQCIDDFDYSR